MNSVAANLCKSTPARSDEHRHRTGAGSTHLAVYSDRYKGFVSSKYDVSEDLDAWQLVIVTGKQADAAGSTGVSTFYGAAEGAGSVRKRGTADQVISGQLFRGIGAGKHSSTFKKNVLLKQKSRVDACADAWVPSCHARCCVTIAPQRLNGTSAPRLGSPLC